MSLETPGAVVAGTSFQASYSYRKSKAGGVVAIVAGGPRSLFAVTIDQATMLQQLGVISSAPMSGTSGTVTLVAPSSPGTYGVVTVYGPDGGTIDTVSLLVTAVAAAAAAGAVATTPTASSSYVAPSPEPKASDNQTLSAQGADVQTFYVQNYGPGVLAATQFVIDHEHQLAAVGASQPSQVTYTPPPTEPAASNGEHLSDESTDVQTYYVRRYGPGYLAAVGFVQERNASLGTSIAGGQPVVLPAGPGAGGADTGLGGGGGFGGWAGATPTVPNQRQTGAPPPSVGGVLDELTSNKPLLIGAALVAAYFAFGSGGHRR